jgi:hypothetical protein
VPPGWGALEERAANPDVLGMERKRETEETWVVEVLPAEDRRRQGGQQVPPQGSRALGTVVLVAAIAAGLGILALLVVFAATVALVAVPVALGAALIAWASVKWRAWQARRGGGGA